MSSSEELYAVYKAREYEKFWGKTHKKATLPPKKPGSNTTFCSLALIDVERELDEVRKKLVFLENKREEILRQGEAPRSSYFC